MAVTNTGIHAWHLSPLDKSPHMSIISSMELRKIETYLSDLLTPDEMVSTDPSLNGIQVENDGSDISKAAFAVDACAETFQKAADANAGLIVVHHGLFWGQLKPVKGTLYSRLKLLFNNNIALYAAHLPLDKHPEFGNNAVIADILGLRDIEDFGRIKGVSIGYKGKLPEPSDIDTILNTLNSGQQKVEKALPFGPKSIKTVGIVSGGAAKDVYQAIDEGLDLYITGEPSHEVYHAAMESGINIIFGGHYNTETWGVRRLSQRMYSDLNIETVFIDAPTGL